MSTSACENGSQGANFKQVADTFHGLQNRILAQQFDYYILSIQIIQFVSSRNQEQCHKQIELRN